MRPKKDFLYALDTVKLVVVQLLPEHMERPTPDTEWQTQDLFRHMLYELCWTPDVVMGASLAVVGDRYEGDIVGDNPITSWRAAAIRAREAVRRCDLYHIAHLSYGAVPVGEYLKEAAVDQLVHAWDLGKAINVPVTFDETIAQSMYDFMLPRKRELVASGLYAPPVPVPETASTQTRLLGLLGRQADWRPTTVTL
jgi:uncharacterized protein (TIGR03086 family)